MLIQPPSREVLKNTVNNLSFRMEVLPLKYNVATLEISIDLKISHKLLKFLKTTKLAIK